jgi:hypothetical protein
MRKLFALAFLTLAMIGGTGVMFYAPPAHANCPGHTRTS